MFGDNALTRHVGVETERRKRGCVRVNGAVVYRPIDQFTAVHSHRHGTAFSAEVPAQFFLRLDNIFQHSIVDGLARNDKRRHKGADML